MNFELQLVQLPVSDVDRAKAFYTEQAGFTADADVVVSEDLRFVQLTPPGSACSIALGTGSPTWRRGRSRGCSWSSPTCAPRAISPDRIPQPDPECSSEVEVTFEETESATRVCVEHRAFERHGDEGEGYRQALDSEHGWPYMLDCLVNRFT